MEQLWAPWRVEYIMMPKATGCFFCQKSKEDRDAANYILYRGKANFAMLNLYPYNPGHLLVAPYRHLGELEALSEEEASEHMAIVVRCVRAAKKALGPAGLNIGLNLGTVAGAGVADHVHTHVVPRWNGDTNFMPVIGQVKVIPDALESSYRRLKEAIG